MRELRTVIFDMDGTALNDSHELDQLLLSGSERFKREEIELFIATGRLDFMVYDYAESLQLNTPIISCNGALIRHKNVAEPLYANYIDAKIVKEICAYLEKKVIDFHLYSLDGVSGLTPTGRIAYFLKKNEGLAAENQVPLTIGSDVLAVERLQSILKILVLSEEVEVLAEVEQVLRTYDVDVVSSATGLLDVMAVGNTKGQAIKTLHQQNVLDVATTMSFGDNHNDIEMLQVVAVGIAMANAVPELKEHADAIGLSNNENGVGQYLLEYLNQR